MRAVLPIPRPCGVAVCTVTMPAAHESAMMLMGPITPLIEASVWRFSVMSLLNSITST
jgi:hypothetical protein